MAYPWIDSGFLTNSPLPDQQDYKYWTIFSAEGWGGGVGTLGIYRGMVMKLSLNNYLRFDGCKIAQVRGKIEVHFHLLGLQYKAYKFHSIHIYIFPQSAWMPMFFQISTLSSVRQHIFLHPAGNVFHLQS